MIRFANPGGGDFSNSDAYKWLSDHSVDYGFVIRYPENKTEVTGIETAQPQVFRFVGVENAKKSAGFGLLRGGIRRLYPGAKGRLLIQSAFSGIQRGPEKARRKALSSKRLRGGCVFLKKPHTTAKASSAFVFCVPNRCGLLPPRRPDDDDP
mgnify:CR=1 FL=1